MHHLKPCRATAGVLFALPLGLAFTPSQVTAQVKLEWSNSANKYRNNLGQTFSFICPANGSIANVWGTDIYTADSSICTAAVHAGLITTRNGGRVKIRIRPGETVYKSTTRNGLTSSNYGPYDSSFIFLKR